MKLVTIGVTRLVILTKNHAIKIPKPKIWNHFLRGLLANMEENLIWQIANIKDSVLADHKQYLCPVIWCSWGGWILIMKRADELQPTEIFEPIEKLKVLCGDHKPANYGKIDGKLVILDYGEGDGFQHNT